MISCSTISSSRMSICVTISTRFFVFTKTTALCVYTLSGHSQEGGGHAPLLQIGSILDALQLSLEGVGEHRLQLPQTIGVGSNELKLLLEGLHVRVDAVTLT